MDTVVEGMEDRKLCRRGSGDRDSQRDAEESRMSALKLGGGKAVAGLQRGVVACWFLNKIVVTCYSCSSLLSLVGFGIKIDVRYREWKER